MEQILEALLKFLATQGWYGMLVMTMGAVIWDQRRDIRDLQDQNTRLQELRVKDARDLTEKTLISIETTRAAIQGFTEVLRDRRASSSVNFTE